MPTFSFFLGKLHPLPIKPLIVLILSADAHNFLSADAHKLLCADAQDWNYIELQATPERNQLHVHPTMAERKNHTGIQKPFGACTTTNPKTTWFCDNRTEQTRAANVNASDTLPT